MLHIQNTTKQFPNGFVALDSINLLVHPGEIISLVGTSGCGKSTLLRIMAGLDQPSLGQVLLSDKRIDGPHPKVGLIFQEPRLMPWLTVRENIQFGLEIRQRPLYRERVDHLLAQIGLTCFSDGLPRQLSGGMAQRVAIARALVTRPDILLLDEPFSALDAFTRARLQDHVLEIWHDDRPTLILVTHDIEEALVMSDRVVVMRPNPGHIHALFEIDLPRPRRRTDPRLQIWKEQLLETLNLSHLQTLVV